MENAPKRHRGAERGFALVLAIMALMLLTFLGLTLATTTSTELQIATNYRWGQQALFNAEAGLEAGKVILANLADPSAGWATQLPAARSPAWFVGLAPAPSETPSGRDFEKSACDTRANMGYGRILAGNEGVATFMGRSINGGFTLWIRRRLDVNVDGTFFDSVDSTRVILTVEGVAPYRADGPADAFVQANQAVRILEMPLGLALTRSNTPCTQPWGQEGMGPTGDNFDPCSVLRGGTTGSLGSIFGDTSSLDSSGAL